MKSGANIPHIKDRDCTARSDFPTPFYPTIKEGKEHDLFLAFRSGGSRRSLPFFFVSRRPQFHLHTGKGNPPLIICQQAQSAALRRNTAIDLFIEHSATVFLYAGSAFHFHFTHRQLSCGAKDALVFEIENRRVFLRCPGNQLEGITLLA